jgi:hypothetical protein
MKLSSCCCIVKKNGVGPQSAFNANGGFTLTQPQTRVGIVRRIKLMVVSAAFSSSAFNARLCRNAAGCA